LVHIKYTSKYSILLFNHFNLYAINVKFLIYYFDKVGIVDTENQLIEREC
jgi:hypothetical protein